MEDAIRQALAEGRTIRETARLTGAGHGTVQRVKAAMAGNAPEKV